MLISNIKGKIQINTVKLRISENLDFSKLAFRTSSYVHGVYQKIGLHRFLNIGLIFLRKKRLIFGKCGI